LRNQKAMSNQEASDKINELTKEIENLNKTIQEKDAKIASQDAKLRALFTTYIPKKGDRIDMEIADLINNRPESDPLKIMFLRESEGVYRFGTKRVYIKVEHGDKIFVRVGGGFMNIDQFLNKYVKEEGEKTRRKDDVASRF